MKQKNELLLLLLMLLLMLLPPPPPQQQRWLPPRNVGLPLQVVASGRIH
jgi:hypothetical protein